ncbi:MAG: HD-like signal output (HDOD) protein [Planctomycetota bacterium]|jgi:HD-like signal output (HDOD) protein
MEALETRLKNLETLPAVPAALAKLVSLLNETEPDSAEVEAMVEADQAVSLAVLRMANSAALGGQEKLSSIGEAVRRLGTRNLMKVAITHLAGAALNGSGKGYGLVGKQPWEGAVGGGIAAEVVATTLAPATTIDPGVAFTAGLLRDCGKLAMDHLVGVEQLKGCMLDRSAGDQIALENKEYGFDHAELGALLAKHWGLSEDLQDAIRYHHAPPSDGSETLAEVIYIAEILCAHLGIGMGLDGMNYVLHTEVLERHQIDPILFFQMMERVADRFAEFEPRLADNP